MSPRIRVAHLSGPVATIQNTPPLVTSNKAREKYGLPARLQSDGARPRFDALRLQRLAAPAKVYVEQFSAHPLESDVAELYGPPDGYLGADGVFRTERTADSDKPVYEVELTPEDGLYPLPYMARQADGSAWEEECVSPFSPLARQGFFPDGSRVFEEIDRLAIGPNGLAGAISAIADVDFYRGLPSAGFTKGLKADQRTDQGAGDIPPETRGQDYYAYKPYHLGNAPQRQSLATITNAMQAIAQDSRYDGIFWTQGSPHIEETAYWFNLLIDCRKPICGSAAQRPQGQLGSDGPKNIVDSLSYIRSRIWADDQGNDKCGVVLVQEQQIFAARDVAKVDARPGGYRATGGHGGIIGNISHLGNIALTYLPVFRHTYRSDVRLPLLPPTVKASARINGQLTRVPVNVKDEQGRLIEDAIPVVSIIKDGGYSAMDRNDDPQLEADLIASIEHKLSLRALSGFVAEGLVPYGALPASSRNKLLARAAYSGIPVVKVCRGGAEGFTDPADFLVAGSNLTATKARLLLMACLMKFGSWPAAQDPDRPTQTDREATRSAVKAYQAVFDTH